MQHICCEGNNFTLVCGFDDYCYCCLCSIQYGLLVLNCWRGGWKF